VTLSESQTSLKLSSKISKDSPSYLLSEEMLNEDIKFSIEMKLNKLYLVNLSGDSGLAIDVKSSRSNKIEEGDMIKVGPFIMLFTLDSTGDLEYQFWEYNGTLDLPIYENKKKVIFEQDEFKIGTYLFDSACVQKADYGRIFYEDKYILRSNLGSSIYLFTKRGGSRALKKIDKKEKLLIGMREFEFISKKLFD
jgi:hypothetical protein